MYNLLQSRGCLFWKRGKPPRREHRVTSFWALSTGSLAALVAGCLLPLPRHAASDPKHLLAQAPTCRRQGSGAFECQQQGEMEGEEGSARASAPLRGDEQRDARLNA